MVNSINTSNINPVQVLSALNAFSPKTKANDSIMPEIASDGMDINDKSILQNQDTKEIKEFAKVVGEDNLSDEDIQYGLTYGRSVIADYMI